MSQHQSLAIRLEVIFWILTALVAFGVIYPIVSRVAYYPFLQTNIIYIVTFITVTRYLFLLRFTFLARRQVLKTALVFVFVILIFYLVQELNYFQTFIDEQGMAAIVGNLPYERQDDMGRYIHSQMLLFGVGSIISSVLFPFRLIISVWRTRNLGRV